MKSFLNLQHLFYVDTTKPDIGFPTRTSSVRGSLHCNPVAMPIKLLARIIRCLRTALAKYSKGTTY